MSLRALYGTDEPPPDRLVLRAGPLEAILEEGALRTVTHDGREVLRGVAFLLRDVTWNTAATEVSDLAVDQREEGFEVAFRAVARAGGVALPWEARIEGRPGRLAFRAEARPLADVVTARTGFVVLQPLAGTAGRRVHVTHVDGQTTRGRFPDLIDPEPCFTDVRALAFEAAPGLRAVCTLEGDAWEMEDHRNWLDASLKTYVRPLRLPSPYTLAAGSRHAQSVTLDLEGGGPPPGGASRRGTSRRAASGPVGLAFGAATTARMPSIGLRLGEDATMADAVAARPLGAQHLLARLDLAAGDLAGRAARVAAVAEALGAEAALEAILPCEEDAEDELARLARALGEANLRPASILLAPASRALRMRPGPPAPPDARLARVHLAARTLFPRARLGGGTVGAFAELNRNRPPFGLVDFVSHSASSLVHAADDATVMENLETFAAQARSLRAMAGAVPRRLGAVGIALDPGPFAPTVANPLGRRLPLARSDPRSAGLLGAAWMVGALAALAAEGVEAVAPATIAGGAPVLDGTGVPLPAWHVVRAAAAGAGRPVRPGIAEDPRRLAALAWDEGGGRAVAWVANLTAAPVALHLPAGAVELSRYEAQPEGDEAVLGPYGVLAVALDA